MKKMILFEILKQIQARPALFKKLKIFAIVGVVGITVVGGLTIWAGYSALRYASSTVSNYVGSTLPADGMARATEQIQSLKFEPLNCWNRAQALLTAKPWLEKSAADNLKDLKVACLNQQPASCEGANCETTHQSSSTEYESWI